MRTSMIPNCFWVIAVLGAASVVLLGCDQPTSGGSGDSTPPGEVSDFHANAGNRELRLSWDDPRANDLKSIKISWSPKDGEGQPKTVSAGTESATILGLENGTEYTVSAKSVDTAGNSSAGTSVTAPAVYLPALFSNASAGFTGVERGSSSFADIDDDEDLDLVITGYDSPATHTATVYTNDGDGGFSDASAGLTGVENSSSAFGDVDGDKDMDLLVTGGDQNFAPTATLYTNDSTGSFSDASAGIAPVSIGSSSFGDVDGDGNLDLVITGYDENDTPSATLYTNDGSGNFSAASVGLTGVRNSTSSFGDVDGDGDLDLVITGFDGSNTTAKLYTNGGDGNFSEASAGFTGVDYGSSSFGDVDGDGDLDLVITGLDDSDTPTATLYTNDGSGNFSKASAGLTGVERSSSSFGDVDRDGDLDLVITGQDDEPALTATLYTNDGDGNFSAVSMGLTGVWDSSSSFGDVDGDGDLDLVVTGYDGSDSARLYENQLF